MIDPELLTWIFLGGGFLLMIIETFIPGGISFFLGLSGLIVGALRYFGLLVDPTISAAAWLVCSVILVTAFRPLLKKYWGGESFFKLADEDFEAMDEVVKVIEPINARDNSGRIHFHGSSWKARTETGQLPAGSKAKIKYRDNVTWVVEPADDLEENQESFNHLHDPSN